MSAVPVTAGVDRSVRRLAAAIGGVFLAGLCVLAIHDPVPIVSALFVAGVAIAVVKWPIHTLAGVLFLQPFHGAILSMVMSRAHLAVGGPVRNWEDILIVVLFLRALYERLRQDRQLPLTNVGDNLILFYIFAYVALAAASPSRPTLGIALVVYIEGPLLFLAIRWLRPSRRQLWAFALAILGAATIMGAAAVFERLGPQEGFLRWFGVSKEQIAYNLSISPPYRAASFLIDTLTLAFYLAAASAFAAAVAGIRSRWRPAAVFAFAACAGGLVVTVTRSGYIGGAVGVVVALLLAVRNPRVRFALAGLVVVAGGAVAGYYVSNGTLRRGGDTAHREFVQRDLDLVVARPFGYGLGTTDRFKFARNPGSFQLGATEETYMSRALEGGIQALILYLSALFVMLMRLRGARLRGLRAGDGQAACLAAGATGLIVAVALSGLFLGMLERVIEIMLWGVPAIALSFPIVQRRRREAAEAREEEDATAEHATVREVLLGV